MQSVSKPRSSPDLLRASKAEELRREGDRGLHPPQNAGLAGPLRASSTGLVTAMGPAVHAPGLHEPTLASAIPPLLLSSLERNLLNVKGEGSADERYTNRNAFSKVALGKGRKAALMKSM